MRWRINHQFLTNNPHGEAYLKRVGTLNGLGDDMLAISGLMTSVVDFIFGDGGWTWKPYLRETVATQKHGPYGYKWWLDDQESDRVNMVLATK